MVMGAPCAGIRGTRCAASRPRCQTPLLGFIPPRSPAVNKTDDVDVTITQVAIPASRFRVGFFVSDIMEIEPSLAFALLSGDRFAVRIEGNHLPGRVLVLHAVRPARNRPPGEACF